MHELRKIAVCAMAIAALTLGAAAAEEPVELETGDEAPDFALPQHEDLVEAAEQSGEELPAKLSDLRGEKNVLLAFYPRAFTSGCTAQLCGYRDDFSRFLDADTEVVAISTDTQEESNAFRKEYEMPFYVLGDEERAAVEAYGVPLIERDENAFAARAVYLIDKEGRIRYIDLEYSITEDLEPLYKAMEELAEEQRAEMETAEASE